MLHAWKILRMRTVIDLTRTYTHSPTRPHIYQLASLGDMPPGHSHPPNPSQT